MNQLLSSFPASVTQRLLKNVVKVRLDRGTVLHEPYQSPKFAYFPSTGVCSVVTRASTGHSVETGMLGNEGCTGAIFLLGQSEVPSQYVQQVAGVSLRIPYAALEHAFCEWEPVRNCILALIQVWTLSMGQLVACQRLHHAEQRLARWLLMARQRSRTDTFQLSHEFMAEMLGCGRPKVTLLLLEFRERGFVDSGRNGLIRIRNVAELEATACECHDVITRLYDGLYAGRPTSRSRPASTSPVSIQR